MKFTWKLKALAPALVVLAMASIDARAQMVTPDQCSPLKEKKVLILPGNGHNEPRLATLTNLRNMATQVGFTIKADGNALALTDQLLAEYDIVVFNYFFGTQLAANFPQTSKDAFMRWLKKGKKGYVGYHTSGANEWATNEWRDYQDSVTGMRYALHGAGTPTGTVTKTTDAAVLNHPIMKGLPNSFTGADEWYEYNTDSKIFIPSFNWKIMYYLTSVASPRSPGPPNHPAAWFREDPNGSRYFYSIFIHTQDGANSDFFKSILLRALEYVAGPTPPGYPSPCVTSISSEGGARAPQPFTSFVTSNRELRVEVDGEYRLSIWSPEGKELYAIQGAGRKTYAPAPFRNKGLYVVQIDGSTRSFTQKILVY